MSLLAAHHCGRMLQVHALYTPLAIEGADTNCQIQPCPLHLLVRLPLNPLSDGFTLNWAE